MFSMIIVLPLVILWLTYRWFRHKNTIDNYGSRYVFITGCDSGFGNMLTKRLDGLGFNVFAGCLTQAGEEKLTLETSEKVKTIRIDVSETESIEDAFNTVKSSLPSDTGKCTIPYCIKLNIVMHYTLKMHCQINKYFE